MEAWLTLPVRLIVAILVGYLTWTVTSTSLQPLESRLAGTEVATSAAAPDSGTSELERRTVLAITIAISTAIALFVFWEWSRYLRFRKSIAAVSKLGGTVRFAPETDATIFQFLFATPTIDLSEVDFRANPFPRLSSIPRLNSLRLSQTNLQDSAFQELSWCRSLISLDLSSAGATDTNVVYLLRLLQLKNLLLSDNPITDGGLMELSKMKSLEKVELFDTQVTPQAIESQRELNPLLKLLV